MLLMCNPVATFQNSKSETLPSPVYLRQSTICVLKTGAQFLFVLGVMSTVCGILATISKGGCDLGALNNLTKIENIGIYNFFGVGTFLIGFGFISAKLISKPKIFEVNRLDLSSKIMISLFLQIMGGIAIVGSVYIFRQMKDGNTIAATVAAVTLATGSASIIGGLGSFVFRCDNRINKKIISFFSRAKIDRSNGYILKTENKSLKYIKVELLLPERENKIIIRKFSFLKIGIYLSICLGMLTLFGSCYLLAAQKWSNMRILHIAAEKLTGKGVKILFANGVIFSTISMLGVVFYKIQEKARRKYNTPSGTIEAYHLSVWDYLFQKKSLEKIKKIALEHAVEKFQSFENELNNLPPKCALKEAVEELFVKIKKEMKALSELKQIEVQLLKIDTEISSIENKQQELDTINLKFKEFNDLAQSYAEEILELDAIITAQIQQNEINQRKRSEIIRKIDMKHRFISEITKRIKESEQRPTIEEMQSKINFLKEELLKLGSIDLLKKEKRAHKKSENNRERATLENINSVDIKVIRKKADEALVKGKEIQNKINRFYELQKQITQLEKEKANLPSSNLEVLKQEVNNAKYHLKSLENILNDCQIVDMTQILAQREEKEKTLNNLNKRISNLEKLEKNYETPFKTTKLNLKNLKKIKQELQLRKQSLIQNRDKSFQDLKKDYFKQKEAFVRRKKKAHALKHNLVNQYKIIEILKLNIQPLCILSKTGKENKETFLYYKVR